MYPQNKEEADSFAAGLMKLLHSPESKASIMKTLTDEKIPVVARLATVATNIMNVMLMHVRNQAKRKPHITLLAQAIKMLIIEASRMAMIAGVKITMQDQQNAGKMAGDLLEKSYGQQQGQPAPMAGQQPQMPQSNQGAGIIGGAM